MVKLLSRLLLSIGLLVAAVAPFSVSPSVLADAKDTVCNGAGSVVNQSGCKPQGEAGGVESAIVIALNIFSWIIGITAVLAIMFGGLQYILASGDSARITKAKNTILYAIIGLVIVAMAQVIVRFVISMTL